MSESDGEFIVLMFCEKPEVDSKPLMAMVRALNDGMGPPLKSHLDAHRDEGMLPLYAWINALMFQLAGAVPRVPRPIREDLVEFLTDRVADLGQRGEDEMEDAAPASGLPKWEIRSLHRYARVDWVDAATEADARALFMADDKDVTDLEILSIVRDDET